MSNQGISKERQGKREAKQKRVNAKERQGKARHDKAMQCNVKQKWSKAKKLSVGMDWNYCQFCVPWTF